MQKYKDIPAWWFWVMLFANTAIALALVLVWPHIFQLPWWGVIMGFCMSVLFTLPIGVLVATTNRVCKNHPSNFTTSWKRPENPKP